jgi:hypothetical protein
MTNVTTQTQILNSVTPPQPPPQKKPKMLPFMRESGKILQSGGHATDGNITRRTRIACWLPKAKNTHLRNM